MRQDPDAGDQPAGVSVVAGIHVLRVVLDGVHDGAHDGTARATRVTATVVGHDAARESWSCVGATTELDLNPLLAKVTTPPGDLRSAALSVVVDHPLHLRERLRVPLSRGVKDARERTIHELRVRLVAAGVIHGRVTRVGGAPVVEGLAGALRLERSQRERKTTDGATLTDVPIEDEGRAVECAADGGFELRVPASGRYALVSYEGGRRPTTTHVEVRVGARVDVGTLVVESGHAITGHVLRRGAPMTGATVSLRPPKVFWAADPAAVQKGLNKWIRPWRTFRSDARSVTLAWLGGRFELGGQRARVAADGAFAFGGLATRDYRLRVVELAGSRFVPSGWDNPAMGREGPDERVVRAPARGVVFDYNWTTIRFELTGEVERAAKGRLVLRTRSLYRGNAHTHIPEFWSAQFPLTGDQPAFVLQAPCDKRMLGEVTFPGRRPVPLDFRTPRAGGEVVVPVTLVRAADAATLSIAVANPPAGLPEDFVVMLRRAGRDRANPDIRPAKLDGGRLRIAGLAPGKYRVRVFASKDTNHPGIHFPSEFDVDLPAGRLTRRSIRMRQGAGLRIKLRDPNGKQIRGNFELYDEQGKRVRLCVVASGRWKPGSDRWASLSTIHPYGAARSSDPIRPGRYRLVVFAPGLAKRTVKVELRPGEYEDVDVELSK